MSTSTGVFIAMTPSLLINSGEFDTTCDLRHNFFEKRSQLSKNFLNPSFDSLMDVAVAYSMAPVSKNGKNESCKTSVQTVRFLNEESASPPMMALATLPIPDCNGCRCWVWDSVWSGGLDDGHDSRWINRNGMQTVLLINRGVGVWFSERWVFWHVNVVQSLEGWSSGVDLDDDLVGAAQHLRRGTDSWTWHDSAILGDGSCLDDGVIQKIIGFVHGVVTVSEVLREHGQMFVEKLGSVGVDRSGDRFTDLVRRTSQNHVILSPLRFFWTGRGTHEQVEGQFALQTVLFNVIHKSLRNDLRGSHSSEARPSEILTVLE
ncbi:hypothetical protein OGATHE_004572 [Ogataea polymorpha]|uniref:Uncharacterized protein n=1 Tax=Ogataea polymorpha TaxID=460523 RepID=A0A9P8P118_9ASCO|nr:hypothetical protein OGATHE_004572 [Ogataea polymorpha]